MSSDKVTNPTTLVFKTLKQERETAEGFRIGSQPVVAGRISQGSTSERGEKNRSGQSHFQHRQWELLMKDNGN